MKRLLTTFCVLLVLATGISTAMAKIKALSNADITMPTDGEGPTQTSCTGTLKDSGGDSLYQNNTNSTITIAPDSASSISLHFTSFQFERDFDDLFIYDGPDTRGPLIGHYTGNGLPEEGDTIRSITGAVTIVQETDFSGTREGFELNWQCDTSPEDENAVYLPGSGKGEQITACEGILKDNGGNNLYDNNTDGRVTIAPDEASAVTLNFNEFSFEENHDFLYVYDGADTSSPLIGKYHGSSLPAHGTITSSGGAITIRQVTSALTKDFGFDLNWSCFTDSIENDSTNMPLNGTAHTLKACAGTLRDSGGDTIYHPNTNSAVTIAPEGATSVSLHFTSFQFERDFDKLFIYDGPDTRSPLIGYYTDDELPEGGNTIHSTTGAITIVQETDGSGNFDGFELNWQCDVINTIKTPAKTQSPTLYPNPASGMVRVDLHNRQNHYSRIMLLNGRKQVLLSKQIHPVSQQNIDVSAYPQGLYFVQLESKKGTETYKLLVK